MASLNELLNDKKEVEKKIKTLKNFKPKFEDLESDFSTIPTYDKSVIDGISFWKGSRFNEFNKMAADLTRGDNKYLDDFDTIEARINSRIKQLNSEKNSLARDITLKRTEQRT